MDTQTAQAKKNSKFNFRSIFVKEDMPTTVPAAVSAATAPAQIFSQGPLYQSPLPSSASVDPEVRDALLQSLDENKLAGYDYLKFIAALEEMKSCGGNEESRFKMAYIAAKQLGVDKNQLLKTADHYKQVLQQDSQDFNNDLAQKQTETVGAHEDRIKQIDAAVAERNDQIAKLNAEITQLQQEKGSLSGQVMENRAKLEVRKRSFEVTLAALTSEIDSNTQKINQYIS